jgi:FLVCR family feline leukemia virus subgroup C receptor-related protein
MLYSEILDSLGDIAANLVMAVFLIVGTIITAFIKSDLRRQNAHAPTTPTA